MPYEHKITCDACGGDLTYTGNSVDYRLALKNESLPTNPAYSAVTDMMIYRPIDRDAYFCSVQCLTKWILIQHPDTVARVTQRLATDE